MLEARPEYLRDLSAEELQEVLARATQLVDARDSILRYGSVMYGERFAAAKHHRLIAKYLERIERGDIDRLIISMPPRSGKSLLTSTLFPAWYLGRHPHHEFMFATYAQDLSSGFGRQVRNYVASDGHLKIFPTCRLAKDSGTFYRFATTVGGSYYAVGVGGPLTGRGANILLVDDPVKNREESSSDAVMTALHEWFTSAAYTRLMPNGKVILIQTRWSENDLIGWVLREQAEEGWAVLSLPAIAEQDEWVEESFDDDAPMRRVGGKTQWLFRKRGEALWPEQYPLPALERIQRAIPRRDWMSLYQQRVSEEDGTLFKREWIQYLDRPPVGAGMNVYILVDPANAKHKRSDSTAMWVVGLGQDRNYYVLDGIRDKLNLSEKADALFELHRKWHPLRVGYEEYAIQADIQYIRDRMQRENYRFEITPLRGLTKKQHRIEALEPVFRNKRVFFPKTMVYTQRDGKLVDLTREFLAEYIAFPAGAHDDMLDALSRIVDQNFQTSWPLTNEEQRRFEDRVVEQSVGRTWMSA